MKAKFTVVIPLYNKGKHIKRALESVFLQQVGDLEIIVIDDGSTDNGPEVVKNIRDSRIRLIQQPNCGVSAARNLGIREAKSDLIVFLDADDEWTPVFLNTISKLRERYPSAGLYATSFKIVERSGNLVEPRFKYVPSAPWEGIIPNYFKTLAYGVSPIWTSAVCVPKAVFFKTGYFVVGEDYREDIDMWSRIALDFSIAFSNDTGAIYYRNTQNRACLQHSDYDELFIINSFISMLRNRNISPENKKYISIYINKRLISIAGMYVLSGENSLAIEMLDKCEGGILILKRLYWLVLAKLPRRLMVLVYRFKGLIFGGDLKV